MKTLATSLFALLMLVLASCSKTQSTSTASVPRPINASWYKLDQRDVYVTDFSLEAGGSKPVEIISDVPLFVGFRTDASVEVVKRYYRQMPQPVRLEVVGVKSFIGSVIGCGDDFPPVAGKLRFTAVNETEVPLKLVVFKHKSTRSVVWPGLEKPNVKQ
jgi:hypothetical protein